MDEKTHQSRLFLTGIFTIGAVIVVLFLIIIYSRQSNRQKNPLSAPGKAVKTQQVTPVAEAKYKLTSSKITYNVGDEIELIVRSDTNREAVVGYDVALKFGPQVSYEKSESMVSVFNLYDTSGEGYVVITGAKKLGDEQAVVFSDTDIMKIYLKAVKKGQVNIRFDFEEGSISDSNLMNEKNEDLLKGAEGLTLTVL